MEHVTTRPSTVTRLVRKEVFYETPLKKGEEE